MKRNRYITIILLFVSILMPMVPVMPHHHHADGHICLKNDLHDAACDHPHPAAHHDGEARHCCCDTGCLTTHFFQRTPTLPSPDGPSVTPLLPWMMPLYLVELLMGQRLSAPEQTARHAICPYRERLHDTPIACTGGLRAPPVVVLNIA